MLPALTLGPLSVPTAGLVLILGTWLGLDALERSARLTGLDGETVYGVAAAALLAGLVGARVAFVWLFWPAFADNWVSMVWPLTHGYSVVAGVAVGGITAVYLARFRRLPFLATLDAAAPALLILLMTVSLAEFLSGSSFGTPTNLPWRVSLAGVWRHPVQLYELGLGAAALGAWWRVVNRGAAPNQGRPFLVATALYATGRLFLDSFRADPPLTETGFHIIQLICLAVALVALFLLRQMADAGLELTSE